MDRIYLDNAATTPIDPAVREAMLPYWNEAFGNPSSIHHEGHTARVGLDNARRDIAEVLDCRARDVVLTPSATASDNLALRGVVEQAIQGGNKKPHVVVSAIEHKAILRPAELLKERGMIKLTIVGLRSNGVLEAEEVVQAVQPDTVLVSVMMANSEIGTVQPVRDIARLLHERDEHPYIHTDAVQAAGWMDVRPKKLGVDLLTVSAHKIYGPKGAGLLYIREGVDLAPLVCGGGQERGLFSGTENVAGIVGLARALQMVREKRDEENERVAALRDRLLAVLEELPFVSLTVSRTDRLPNNIHVTLDGIDAESAVIALDREGIAASTGSACASGSAEPSHVLKAIGYTRDQARCGLRFTLGHMTTKDDIVQASQIIPTTLERLHDTAR